jgi:outer membrane lipoprotein carrier protein
MFRNMSAVFCLAALCAAPAHADATASLRAFLAGTKTLSADFTQQIIKDGKTSRASSGRFELARPNRLRWETQKPFEQTIVADGKQLWTYDRDLNQVTVRKQSDALAQTPAAILAGGDLDALYTLKNVGEKDGIDWLEATPKARDSLFASVALGFKGADLAYMEIKDNFGQVSRVLLSNQKRNAAQNADLLSFKPPAGADVLQQ